MKQKFLITCALVFCVSLFGSVQARAFSEISTEASYAALLDMETGTLLFERNAKTLMPPASMTKIVTLALLFEEIQANRISLDDEFLVSENAVRKGGEKSGSSTMFLEKSSLVSVENLIRGVVVHSGNDAAITIAENLAANEDAFAEKMTAYAKKIGMLNSAFKNATGWPQEGHETTAYDLALLARHHIKTYPEFYPYYAEQSFKWNNVRQSNRNLLLRDRIGVDGLKTGRTEVSGYGIVASAKKGKRRLVLVLNGLKSAQVRRGEGYRILNWGFRAFQTYRLFQVGQVVDKIAVWHGENKQLPVSVEEDFSLAITRERRRLVRVSVDYSTPIPAPIKKGDKVGWIRAKELGGSLIAERPLIAMQDVPELGFLGRAVSTLEYMLFGEGK